MMLLIFSVLLSPALGWLNDWDQQLNFHCVLEREYIFRLQSIHDNHREDRRWDFTCRTVPYEAWLSHCDTSDWINSYKGRINFRCPSTRPYISGLHSVHNNDHEDRRWRVRCCNSPGACRTDCRWTDNINEYDREMDYTVPDGYVLSGLRSSFDGHRNDRRWQLYICRWSSC